MKQYTTPTVRIAMEGCGPLLAEASQIIVTVSDGVTDIDLTPTVEGDNLTVTLTEKQTARLQAGTIEWEITIAYGEHVYKTKTIKTRLQEAVRDEVI